MKWLLSLALMALLSVAPRAGGQPTVVGRPKILGVAHLAVFVSDVEKARAFYSGLLGFDEPFTVPAADGTLGATFVKINDRQWIELVNAPDKGEGQLDHIALYTDDVARMRLYLATKVASAPTPVVASPTGDRSFTVTDADNHRVEFVEYVSGSRTSRTAGQSMPATRLSSRAMHIGILVGSLDAATKFYGGLLGFSEFWRGNSASSKTLSWVNMKVPDGPDYLEFMLYDELPAPDRRGSAHHLCLEISNAEAAVASFNARPQRSSYTRPVEIRTGVNRKRQINLFDPDGTRVELMEPLTVDGKPAPSSTLPPPR